MNWTDTRARSYPRHMPGQGPLAPRGKRPDWMDDAACKGQTAVFFPKEGANTVIVEAKRICAGCPVTSECLAYALQHKEPGIWGGTTGDERDRIRRRAQRVLL